MAFKVREEMIYVLSCARGRAFAVPLKSTAFLCEESCRSSSRSREKEKKKKKQADQNGISRIERVYSLKAISQLDQGTNLKSSACASAHVRVSKQASEGQIPAAASPTEVLQRGKAGRKVRKAGPKGSVRPGMSLGASPG